MSSSRLRRCMLAVAALAVVGAAAGGISYATSGDGGTLAACAKNENGQLRLDSGGGGCASSEHAVALGTAAASHADERYYKAASLADATTWLPLAVGFFGQVQPTRVVSTQLAAGDYTMSAQVTAANRSGSGVLVCVFLDGSRIVGIGQAALGVDAGYSFQHSMTLSGALSLDHDATIDLSCWSSPKDPLAHGAPGVLVADITTTTVGSATITQDTH